MNIPSPCTWPEGTHVGVPLQSLAMSGRSSGSPVSSGASTRVKPSSALTSLSRSSNRMPEIRFSNPFGTGAGLLRKCGPSLGGPGSVSTSHSGPLISASKLSPQSRTSWQTGSREGGIASTDSVIGNQLLVAPSSTVRACSLQSSS